MRPTLADALPRWRPGVPTPREPAGTPDQFLDGRGAAAPGARGVADQIRGHRRGGPFDAVRRVLRQFEHRVDVHGVAGHAELSAELVHPFFDHASLSSQRARSPGVSMSLAASVTGTSR